MIAAVQCFNCIHYRGEARCAAYPTAIPVEIITLGAEHDEQRGDEEGGVTFVLNPERAAAEDARRTLKARSSRG